MESEKKLLKLRANRNYYKKNRARLCMRAIERYRKKHLINGNIKYSVEHGDIFIDFN